MHNFKYLFKGEMQRLIKYKILQVSFVVTILWLLILFLIGSDEVKTFVPLFIFMDVSMMTVLLIGANLFFEKQENTLKTLLITPSGFAALMMSKLIASIYVALQSTVLISIAAYFLFNADVIFYALIPYAIIIALMHTVLGFTFAVYVRDFNGMLGLIMSYMVLFAIPSILYGLGIFGELFEYVLLFSPTHVALLLINHAYGDSVSWILLTLGILYLIALSVILLKVVVIPKYVETAVRE